MVEKVRKANEDFNDNSVKKIENILGILIAIDKNNHCVAMTIEHAQFTRITMGVKLSHSLIVKYLLKSKEYFP